MMEKFSDDKFVLWEQQFTEFEQLTFSFHQEYRCADCQTKLLYVTESDETIRVVCANRHMRFFKQTGVCRGCKSTWLCSLRMKQIRKSDESATETIACIRGCRSHN
jgi:hypothetical protein